MVTFSPCRCFLDSLHNSWIRGCHNCPYSFSLSSSAVLWIESKALCLLCKYSTINLYLTSSFSFFPFQVLPLFPIIMWCGHCNKLEQLYYQQTQCTFILSYHFRRRKSKISFTEVNRADSCYRILAESSLAVLTLVGHLYSFILYFIFPSLQPLAHTATCAATQV